MHAVAAFFASIIAVVGSVFASPTVAPNAPVNIRAKHAAAAATTQIATTTSNPFFDPSAPPVSPADTTLAFSPPPSQTVINQPVIERIIERIVPQGGSSISAEKLAAILTEFGQSIETRIAAVASAPIAFSGPAPSTPISTAAFAPSQRIDQLTNTSINTPTITGGSISGATLSGTLSGTFSGAVSSLAMSSIPSGLIATDASGNFLATSTPTAAAYIATSTTATSTFAGGLTAANGNFSILQNGYVGIGTTTPGSLLSLSNIANITTATSTFYSTGGISLAAGCFAKAGSCLSFTDLVGTLGIAQGGTGASTATGATENLQFLQNGTGAVARSVSSKFAETISIKDFGAQMDGVTDDTAALQAAINAGSKIIIPPGVTVIDSVNITADNKTIECASHNGSAIFAKNVNSTVFNVGTSTGNTRPCGRI